VIANPSAAKAARIFQFLRIRTFRASPCQNPSGYDSAPL
jgi:hypothetical protein